MITAEKLPLIEQISDRVYRRQLAYNDHFLVALSIELAMLIIVSIDSANKQFTDIEHDEKESVSSLQGESIHVARLNNLTCTDECKLQYD